MAKRPTQAEVAEHLGLENTRRVRELIARGVIPNPRIATLDEIRLAAFSHYREAAAGRTGEAVDELQALRLRKAAADAETAELDLQERRGQVLPTEGVVAYWGDQYKQIQRSLRAIPKRLVALGVLTKSQAKPVLEEIDGGLNEIAGVGAGVAKLGSKRDRGSARKGRAGRKAS